MLDWKLYFFNLYLRRKIRFYFIKKTYFVNFLLVSAAYIHMSRHVMWIENYQILERNSSISPSLISIIVTQVCVYNTTAVFHVHWLIIYFLTDTLAVVLPFHSFMVPTLQEKLAEAPYKTNPVLPWDPPVLPWDPVLPWNPVLPWDSAYLGILLISEFHLSQGYIGAGHSLSTLHLRGYNLVSRTQETFSGHTVHASWFPGYTRYTRFPGHPGDTARRFSHIFFKNFTQLRIRVLNKYSIKN